MLRFNFFLLPRYLSLLLVALKFLVCNAALDHVAFLLSRCTMAKLPMTLPQPALLQFEGEKEIEYSSVLFILK